MKKSATCSPEKTLFFLIHTSLHKANFFFISLHPAMLRYECFSATTRQSRPTLCSFRAVRWTAPCWTLPGSPRPPFRRTGTRSVSCRQSGRTEVHLDAAVLLDTYTPPSKSFRDHQLRNAALAHCKDSAMTWAGGMMHDGLFLWLSLAL